MTLPRLYAIADSAMFDGTEALCLFAQELATAGVTLIQYRSKSGRFATSSPSSKSSMMLSMTDLDFIIIMTLTMRWPI